MGKKKVSDIDPEQLEKLAQLHCSLDEAAAFFGCGERALRRWLDGDKRDPALAEAWERGRAQGRLSLRRLQWQHANGTGASAIAMTIHLSKHWLGESDRALLELTGKDGGPIAHRDLSNLTDDDLDRIEGILRKAAEPGKATEPGKAPWPAEPLPAEPVADRDGEGAALD